MAFISDLIQWLADKEHIDTSRVYVTGMSNGGFMTSTLGCQLADKIAAIASVAATFPGSGEVNCKPSRTMPAMIIMGDHDPLVPYSGGEMAHGAHGTVLSATAAADVWAKAAGCGATPASSTLPDSAPDDGTTTTMQRYSGCRDEAEVVLLTVVGGGHTWPGGLQYANERLIGKTSRDFEASERIWEFFKDKKR